MYSWTLQKIKFLFIVIIIIIIIIIIILLLSSLLLLLSLSSSLLSLLLLLLLLFYLLKIIQLLTVTLSWLYPTKGGQIHLLYLQLVHVSLQNKCFYLMASEWALSASSAIFLLASCCNRTFSSKNLCSICCKVSLWCLSVANMLSFI